MAGVWWTRWLRILAVVLAFLVVLAATAAARTAHRRADLVERSVLVTPRTVAAGDTLRITDKVRNRGRAIAARSTVGYYLSRDRVRDAGDLRLGTRATRRLRRRATSTASRTMRIPSATAGGTYRLVACADIRHRARESGERNNCRAAARSITVTAGGGGA